MPPRWPRRSSRSVFRDPFLAVYVAVTLLGLLRLADWAAPVPPQGAACRLGYVYDGDTVELICGASAQAARLIGLDTPELAGRCAAETAAALAAKRALAGLVSAAQRVEIGIEGRDRYGRPLIRLWLDGTDAARLMLRAGHGRAYDGAARAGWC
ncbi:thermonuclease family protein [Neotabrizicola sp. VNH66]|uniref:thermonuclease family protein n=1 Tax=Neotabrizicola sp. VNH66 TaxID=3400918 RepID=UPI003C04BC69